MKNLWLLLCLLNSSCGYYHYSNSIGPACFPGDALVATTQGPKRISELKANDEVVSFDFGNETFTIAKIESLEIKQASYLLELIFESGTVLLVTADHPLLKIDSGVKAYQRADTLEPGHRLVAYNDQLVAEDETISEVNRIEWSQPVYNLKVRRYENFVVHGIVAYGY